MVKELISLLVNWLNRELVDTRIKVNIIYTNIVSRGVQ